MNVSLFFIIIIFVDISTHTRKVRGVWNWEQTEWKLQNAFIGKDIQTATEMINSFLDNIIEIPSAVYHPFWRRFTGFPEYAKVLL